jgi:hypothetical protein
MTRTYLTTSRNFFRMANLGAVSTRFDLVTSNVELLNALLDENGIADPKIVDPLTEAAAKIAEARHLREATDIEASNVEDLKSRAKDLGVPKYSSMNREELEDAIREKESQGTAA